MPVVHSSIPLEFLAGIVLILDIHPSVVGVVTNLELAELLCKQLRLSHNCLSTLVLSLHLSDSGLLSLNEFVYCFLFLQRQGFPFAGIQICAQIILIAGIFTNPLARSFDLLIVNRRLNITRLLEYLGLIDLEISTHILYLVPVLKLGLMAAVVTSPNRTFVAGDLLKISIHIMLAVGRVTGASPQRIIHWRQPRGSLITAGVPLDLGIPRKILLLRLIVKGGSPSLLARARQAIGTLIRQTLISAIIKSTFIIAWLLLIEILYFSLLCSAFGSGELAICSTKGISLPDLKHLVVVIRVDGQIG